MTNNDRLQGLFHYYPESESIRLMIAGRELSFRRYGDDIWQKLELYMQDGLPPLPQAKQPIKCAYCRGILPDQCTCPLPAVRKFNARGKEILPIDLYEIFKGEI